MKKSNLFLMTSVFGIALITGGCTMCHVKPMHNDHNPEAPFQKHKHSKKTQHKQGPSVFYQTYDESNPGSVKANVYTRSANGGESEMGTIQFIETTDGLKMYVDLIDLRPGKSYTAQLYQCFECNESLCCDTEAMSIDLPQIKTKTTGRLKQSYIIRGLTATQLNNAKLILTRDGGYKAAWGTLLN